MLQQTLPKFPGNKLSANTLFNNTNEVEGTVTEVLPDRSIVSNWKRVINYPPYATGKMRRFRIRVVAGDKVKIELSLYDLYKGSISYRYKD